MVDQNRLINMFVVLFTVYGVSLVVGNEYNAVKRDLEKISESDAIINFFMQDLEGKFEKLEEANDQREARKAERREDNKKKGEQWRARLDQLEDEIADLENFRVGEDKMDGSLESLSEGETVRKETDNQVKLIKENIQQMKKFLDYSLTGVDTRLASVKQSAISRNVKVAGVVLYGGIASACTFDTDCVVRNSECRHDICQCDAGLNFDSLRNECTKSCLSYGSTYQYTRNSMIKGHNNMELNDMALGDCKRECERDDLGFTCRSIDYFPDWKKCFLSEVTVTEVPGSSWVYNSAGIHLQRDCSYIE